MGLWSTIKNRFGYGPMDPAPDPLHTFDATFSDFPEYNGEFIPLNPPDTLNGEQISQRSGDGFGFYHYYDGSQWAITGDDPRVTPTVWWASSTLEGVYVDVISAGDLGTITVDNYIIVGWQVLATYSGEIFLPASSVQPGTSDFSVCFWWQNDNTLKSGTDYTLFSLRQGVGQAGPLFLLWFDPDTGGGQWRCILSPDDNPAHYIEINKPISNNIRCFVAATVSRSGLMKLYINSVKAGEINISSLSAVSLVPDTVYFNHGGNPSGYHNTTYFDQFRYYKNRILSDEEILYLYNAGSGFTVNKDVFASLCNDGCFIEFNDYPSPISGSVTLQDTFAMSILSSGVWDDTQKAALEQYNNFGFWEMSEGGVVGTEELSNNLPGTFAGHRSRRR